MLTSSSTSSPDSRRRRRVSSSSLAQSARWAATNTSRSTPGDYIPGLDSLGRRFNPGDAEGCGGFTMAEVVTGEAVVLDLAIGRVPSRIVALLLDMLVEIPLFLFVELVVFKQAAQHLNAASADAIYTVGFILVLVGYPTIFETLTRGKTMGKMALGLRVVSDDGGPIRFRQALIRGLMAAFVEIWNPLLCVVGLTTALFSAKGKRLGDLAAGTFVISERVPRRQDLPASLAVIS